MGPIGHAPKRTGRQTVGRNITWNWTCIIALQITDQSSRQRGRPTSTYPQLFKNNQREKAKKKLTGLFYCLIWDSLNLEGQVPVFISPKEQGRPVIPAGTEFPSRRLLRLAGLGWRYSIPLPHGLYDVYKQ
jgi:hypothetical protein